VLPRADTVTSRHTEKRYIVVRFTVAIDGKLTAARQRSVDAAIQAGIR
jgi:hypothetical protein